MIALFLFYRNSVQGPEHARRLEDVVVLRIRRKFILEDGMKAMRSIGPDIKKRLVIKYVNEFNQEEMGIDRYVYCLVCVLYLAIAH